MARLVSLLPLLATLLELPRCRVLLLLLLLLRATPFPARVADAVLGGARVLREVGAGDAGRTLAARLTAAGLWRCRHIVVDGGVWLAERNWLAGWVRQVPVHQVQRLALARCRRDATRCRWDATRCRGQEVAIVCRSRCFAARVLRCRAV